MQSILQSSTEIISRKNDRTTLLEKRWSCSTGSKKNHSTFWINTGHKKYTASCDKIKIMVRFYDTSLRQVGKTVSSEEKQCDYFTCNGYLEWESDYYYTQNVTYANITPLGNVSPVIINHAYLGKYKYGFWKSQIKDMVRFGRNNGCVWCVLRDPSHKFGGTQCQNPIHFVVQDFWPYYKRGIHVLCVMNQGEKH